MIEAAEIIVVILAAALRAGTPLVLAALGELVTEKSGVLNLGVEGMMLVGAVAAIIVTPFRHESFADQELPAPGFLAGLRARCDRLGAVLVLDDVRCGFRLALGGSGEHFGVRPDLACYSKAIANGHPLSAVVGTDALRDAAQRVFFTGTYWVSPVEMAAALAPGEAFLCHGSGHACVVGRTGRGQAYLYDPEGAGGHREEPCVVLLDPGFAGHPRAEELAARYRVYLATHRIRRPRAGDVLQTRAA